MRDSRKSTDTTLKIEFLTGFLTSQPFPDGKTKYPTVSQCNEIWERLDDYYLAVQRELTADALERTGRLHELEFDRKNHSLTVRGEAYPHQLEEMAIGLHEEHDDWFQKNLGLLSRKRCTRFVRRWGCRLGDSSGCCSK